MNEMTGQVGRGEEWWLRSYSVLAAEVYRTLRDLLDETGGSILESQGGGVWYLRWTSDNAVLDQSFRQSVRFEVVWPTVD